MSLTEEEETLIYKQKLGIMFAKGGKGQQQMPSDIQAKEKLAHYVYEYLMHLGAKQSAQIFLQEV